MQIFKTLLPFLTAYLHAYQIHFFFCDANAIIICNNNLLGGAVCGAKWNNTGSSENFKDCSFSVRQGWHIVKGGKSFSSDNLEQVA